MAVEDLDAVVAVVVEVEVMAAHTRAAPIYVKHVWRSGDDAVVDDMITHRQALRHHTADCCYHDLSFLGWAYYCRTCSVHS